MARLTPVDIAVALVLGGGAARAADSVWRIDPAHSSAEFAIPVKDGGIALPAGSDIPANVGATLDVGGIDTKHDDRNQDPRSSDWFDTDTFPSGTFSSTQISGADAGAFTIAGNLTLHGVTKAVVLQARFEGRGVGGRGEHRVAYSATTTIHRKDFGLSNLAANATGALVVGEDADVSLEVEAIGGP